MNKNKGSTLQFWILAITACFFLSASAFAENSLEGGWALTQVVGAEGNIDDEPLPGLVVFTSTHYSMMFTIGDKPRALMGDIPEGESPTDAQLVAAYNSFIANSGRYAVEDGNLITRAYVAKSPDYMAGWPDNAQTYGFTIDGDMLVLETEDGPAAGAKSTFRRVEDASFPPASD
jgi:hypothetical protein